MTGFPLPGQCHARGATWGGPKASAPGSPLVPVAAIALACRKTDPPKAGETRRNPPFLRELKESGLLQEPLPKLYGARFGFLRPQA